MGIGRGELIMVDSILEQLSLIRRDNIDPAHMFKLPMTLISLDRREEAEEMLNHLHCLFLQNSGDISKGKNKSSNPAYLEFYNYIDGWLLRAAILLGMNDVFGVSIERYLRGQRENGGFITHALEYNDGVTDIISTANGGMVCLALQDNRSAIKAGDYLIDNLESNKRKKGGLNNIFLRADEKNHLVIPLPENRDMLSVDKNNEDQLYFMVAFPVAFLSYLYGSSNDERYLSAAIEYADFLIACHPKFVESDASHKTSWALSCLFMHTNNQMYISPIQKIIKYFESIKDQETGLWFVDDVLKSLDQSAEIICWLSEIRKNIPQI